MGFSETLLVNEVANIFNIRFCYCHPPAAYELRNPVHIEFVEQRFGFVGVARFLHHGVSWGDFENACIVAADNCLKILFGQQILGRYLEQCNLLIQNLVVGIELCQ